MTSRFHDVNLIIIRSNLKRLDISNGDSPNGNSKSGGRHIKSFYSFYLLLLQNADIIC